jgi:hypothetical protein
MNRESDEECLKLIAEIRARMGEAAGLATGHEIARLLGNLEARIWEHAPNPSYTEDCPCGTERCREAWRELRQAKADEQARLVKAWEQGANEGLGHYRALMRKEVESCGAAEACRQHVREEVAAEVARQLRQQHEAMASPAIRTWVDNLQHEIDKLRRALEAEGRRPARPPEYEIDKIGRALEAKDS